MKSHAPTYKKLQEVHKLIPKDSWHYKYAMEEGSASLCALVFEGDTELDIVDLDNLKALTSHTKESKDIDGDCALILVHGNLTVKNILNRETDGSSGLIVLGDLTADNIAVGGQELYVKGNLVVRGLYAGEYNHGLLHVEKGAKMRCLVDNDYAVEASTLTADVRFSDTLSSSSFQNEDFSRDILAQHLHKEVLFTDKELNDDDAKNPYSWGVFISYGAICDRLAAGKPVLLDTFVPKEKHEPRESVFSPVSSDDFKKEEKNFKKLVALCDIHEDDILTYEKDDLSVAIHKKYNGKDDNPLIIITTKKGVFTVCFESRKKLALFGSPVLVVYSLQGDEEDGSYLFEGGDTKGQEEEFMAIWKSLLERAEIGIWYAKEFKKVVTQEKVRELATLPIVTELYNDWNDGDKNGFYVGRYKYSFRNPDLTNHGAQVRISVETSSEDSDEGFDCRLYRYVCGEDAGVYPSTVLRYCSSQEEKLEGRYNVYEGADVYFLDWELYKEATRWFTRALQVTAGVSKNYADYKEQKHEVETYNAKPVTAWPLAYVQLAASRLLEEELLAEMFESNALHKKITEDTKEETVSIGELMYSVDSHEYVATFEEREGHDKSGNDTVYRIRTEDELSVWGFSLDHPTSVTSSNRNTHFTIPAMYCVPKDVKEEHRQEDKYCITDSDDKDKLARAVTLLQAIRKALIPTCKELSMSVTFEPEEGTSIIVCV